MEKNFSDYTLFQSLVQACLDTWTAPFSDDASAIKRDNERFANLFANQDEFTLEEIEKVVSDLWNGKVTRAEVFA